MSTGTEMFTSFDSKRFAIKQTLPCSQNFCTTIFTIQNFPCDSKITFKNLDFRTSGVLAKQNGLVTLNIVYKSTTDCIRPNF